MFLSDTDRQYRSLCNRIGAAMLVFYLLFNILSAGITYARDIFNQSYSNDLLNLVLSLSYYASYLFAFMFPVLFFKLISKKHSFPNLNLEFKLSKKLWIIIPAALGINFFFAEINYILLLPINFSELIAEPIPETYYAHDFILDIIGTAIVPAICEEFLFRGLILSALLPYGKKTAVFGSAVLFALMHQNPAQILYTVVLGIIFAYMALETKSIWGGIILHFANNLISVIMTAATYVLEPKIADIIYMSIFLGLMAIGLVIGGVAVVRFLIARSRNKRERALVNEMMPRTVAKGLFGTDKIYTDEEPTFKLTKGYAIRGFFAPCNLFFTVLSIGNMCLLIATALFRNFGG